MKRIFWLFVFLLGSAAILQAEGHWSFKGTVVRMQMGECAAPGRLRGSFFGMPADADCPEYTLMTSDVVYVIVARRSEQFIPLADEIDFLIRNNEIVFFSSDEKSKSRFVIREMMLRADWEREEQRRQQPRENIERAAD